MQRPAQEGKALLNNTLQPEPSPRQPSLSDLFAVENARLALAEAITEGRVVDQASPVPAFLVRRLATEARERAYIAAKVIAETDLLRHLLIVDLDADPRAVTFDLLAEYAVARWEGYQFRVEYPGAEDVGRTGATARLSAKVACDHAHWRWSRPLRSVHDLRREDGNVCRCEVENG